MLLVNYHKIRTRGPNSRTNIDLLILTKIIINSIIQNHVAAQESQQKKKSKVKNHSRSCHSHTQTPSTRAKRPQRTLQLRKESSNQDLSQSKCKQDTHNHNTYTTRSTHIIQIHTHQSISFTLIIFRHQRQKHAEKNSWVDLRIQKTQTLQLQQKTINKKYKKEFLKGRERPSEMALWISAHLRTTLWSLMPSSSSMR